MANSGFKKIETKIIFKLNHEYSISFYFQKIINSLLDF